MGLYILGLDLGAKLGVAIINLDGTPGPVYTKVLKTDLSERVRGVAAIVKQYAGPKCVGVCIEEPFGANPNGAKPLYAMMGAAVLAAEQTSLPHSLAHLSKLKKHMTGKGNADKSEMIQAAQARFGGQYDDNQADAIAAACYALDNDLFVC